jgi:hypothetical protein
VFKGIFSSLRTRVTTGRAQSCPADVRKNKEHGATDARDGDRGCRVESKIAFTFILYQQRAPLPALFPNHSPALIWGTCFLACPLWSIIGLRYCVFGPVYSTRPSYYHRIYAYALLSPQRLRNTFTRCLPHDTLWTPPAARRLHLYGFSTPQSVPPTSQASPRPQSTKHSFTTFPRPHHSPLRRPRASSFRPPRQVSLDARQTEDRRVEGRAHIRVRPRHLWSKSIWKRSQSDAGNGEPT